MKKVFVISAIVIVMSILLLTMTSCGDNPFQRLIQRTSPQEIIAKNVCDAIANRDSQKLYQLFSEEVKMNVPDLKEKTDKLLETYGKDQFGNPNTGSYPVAATIIPVKNNPTKLL